MSKIQLKCSDDVVVTVDLEISKKSTVIKSMLEAFGECDLEEDIPIPNVHSDIFKKVVEWLTRHKDDPELPAEDDEVGHIEIKDWDKDFFNVEHSTLLEILMAANYLNIRPLLHTCSQAIANLINGKSVEEIRSTFNIENDFSPSEEERLRAETAWAEKPN